MMRFQKVWITFTFLSCLMLLTVALVSPIYALDFTVTKTEDTNDGNCDADCSLREAIIAANDNAGLDVITLPAGTFTLTITGTAEDDGATGDLDIIDDLTIIGAGADMTVIDGGGLDRVFDIRDPIFPGSVVQINGVTVQNGNVADSGGGIFVQSGNELNLVNSNVYQNSSTGGDGGGGVYVQGSSTAVLSRTSVISNTSQGVGGGINNNNVLVVVNSTISGNDAFASGGGIYSNHTTDLKNVTIANNSTDIEGGGINVALSTVLTLTNSLLAGNVDDNPQQPSDCQGTVMSGGYNLIQTADNCTITGTLTGNMTGLDPKLAPLRLSGETFSHSLSESSPAVDTGSPSAPGSGGDACPATDQRGFSRPIDGNRDTLARCDIGAIELGKLVYVPLVFK